MELSKENNNKISKISLRLKVYYKSLINGDAITLSLAIVNFIN